MNKYCFCVVKDFEDAKFSMTNEGLDTVKYRDILMIVKDFEEDEIFPTADEMLKHEKTIDNIMKKVDVIPMSFGHLCENEAEIKVFLSKNYDELIKLFNKFKNRIEVGLKIFWTSESFSQEIEDEEIRTLKEEMKEKGNLNQMQVADIGKLVEENVETARDFYVKMIYEKLSDISIESKLNSLPNPKMVLNSAFLIEKDREEEFDKIVGDIYDQYKDNLIFKYTGPWPPYNFIDQQFVV